MKIRYAVHSVAPTDFAVDAVVAGKQVVATVPGIIVEAVSDDGSMGHSFKIFGEDNAAIIKRCSPGDELEITIKLIDKDGKGVLLNAPLEAPEPKKAAKPKK